METLRNLEPRPSTLNPSSKFALESAMLLLPLVLVSLCFGVANAFLGTSTMLAGRSNAVYAKSWGSALPQHSRRVHRGAFQRGATGGVAPPRMSLVLLAEEELPISPEQQESIISVLSVASSALLLVIVGGAVYLSLVEWKNKQELEKSEKKIASTGVLPPEISPEGSSTSGGNDEEGNRLYRRRVKKARQKEKS